MTNPSASSPTVTCPNCHLQHEVFWYVSKSGKRCLSYRCDRIPVLRETAESNWTPELRMGRGIRPVLDESVFTQEQLGSVREVWSKGYREQNQGKQQFQLILMNPKKPTQ